MNQMEDRTAALETQRISTLLLAYALPSVVSQIIASVYNIVDRIFLGQCVGALAIAGLAITMPIMNIVHAFGSLVGVGSAARMSIVLGAKDVRWARRILGNSMYLTIAFGIIGSLIIALLWKVPADGYEKVNKVIAENPEL